MKYTDPQKSLVPGESGQNAQLVTSPITDETKTSLLLILNYRWETKTTGLQICADTLMETSLKAFGKQRIHTECQHTVVGAQAVG